MKLQLGQLARRRKAAPAPAGARDLPSRAQQQPARTVAVEDQWQRLRSLIEATLSRSERAQECHRHAALRIDAASYELARLADELGSVVASRPVRLSPAAAAAAPEAAARASKVPLAA